jgi:hypothetical protein
MAWQPADGPGWGVGRKSRAASAGARRRPPAEGRGGAHRRLPPRRAFNRVVVSPRDLRSPNIYIIFAGAPPAAQSQHRR